MATPASARIPRTWVPALCELGPHETAGPYRYDWYRERWVLVLRGAPTLRHPGGQDVMEPADIVCFPEGDAGAHQFLNHADEPACEAARDGAEAVFKWSETLGPRVVLCPMRAALLIVGLACLLTGVSLVTRREAIAARHRKRTTSAQAPAAYAVMGGILGVAGVLLVLAALL